MGYLDLMIGAHALVLGASCRNDQAFIWIKKLKVQDWTI
jgi:hypothetical protein